ncbi:transposase [Gracilimonas halophila]|uniref:Transposase n=1 Tax=Gracilimonas halophila TaxID=1834464 RepID=A0ABW5JEJ9_9BACT
MNRFGKHCTHIFETYAYCLMGNHFHMVVSVRDIEEQEKLFIESDLRPKKLRSPSKHLAHFFSSYTQSINKQENRTGSLFQKNFKRKEIDSEEYFRQMVVYSHINPIKHGFSKSLTDYPFSSYQIYLNSEETFIQRERTLELFGGRKKFITAHENVIARF